jgi:hypothetical protein
MLFPGTQKVRLAGMFCALALAGCGSGKVSGDGYGIFMWGIFDIEDSTYGYPLTCAETGAGNVVLTLTDQATGAVVTRDVASCSAEQISTSTVPAGVYNASFEFYGDPAVYGNADTLIDAFDAVDNAGIKIAFRILRGANDFRTTYAPLIVQSFVLKWRFLSGPAASYCNAFGASYVDLDFLAEGSSTWVTSRFNCASGQGASFPIPYGPTSAQWQLVLVNAAEQELELIPGAPVALPLETNVNLGTQVFNF